MSTRGKAIPRIKILLVSAQAKERLRLTEDMETDGLEVTAVPNVDLARQILARSEHPLTVIVHDPGRMDALEFLRQRPGKGPRGTIVLAKKGTIEDAVEAMRLGALDFLCAPWGSKALLQAIRAAGQVHVQSPPGETGRPGPSQKKHVKEPDKYEILTVSPLMEALLNQARLVAKSRATILIQGESGTGKELLARFIHKQSDRSEGPFVALNCAALPETLLESELFGHEKGAFSGAVARKAGKFELADKGTLLLDEITEMALPLQAKLLRVLQEGEIDRLGGTKPVPVDVRVIATTNRDVLDSVRSGEFREDLYFRLNVVPFRLPALRERREDIAFLAERFRILFANEYGKSGLKFASGVLEELKKKKWEGNVRQLRNLVERGVLLCQEDEITLQDLLGGEILTQDPGLGNNPVIDQLGRDTFNLNDLEREMVKKALAKTDGNRTHAAKLLGISVRTLRNKLAEYRRMGLVL